MSPSPLLIVCDLDSLTAWPETEPRALIALSNCLTVRNSFELLPRFKTPVTVLVTII